MQVLNDPAVDHGHGLPLGNRLVEGGDLSAGKVNLGFGRGENAVGDVDLRGVDQRLAVIAHVAALLAFLGQPLVVLEGVINAIERDHPVRPRRHQAGLKRIKQRLAPGRLAGAKIFGKVVGAKDKAFHGRMRRDPCGVDHRQRCFHHRPDRLAGHKLHNRVNVCWRVYLRNQHRITVHRRNRGGVLAAPFGV